MINDTLALHNKRPASSIDKCCSLCPLYPCELIPEYQANIKYHGTARDTDDSSRASSCPLSYDKPDLTPCIIRTSTNTIPCGSKHVANGIGDHYKVELNHESKIKSKTINRWERAQPVFISAQTGRGKNYFIENTLIPHIRELNHKNVTQQKILIFSNRRALMKQLEGHMKSKSPIDYFYPDDYVDIMVYQHLLDNVERLNAIQENPKHRYAFVICDEAHFFSSDCMFNPYTQKILEQIVRIFKKSVRIYMSATPYDCLEHIINQEKTSSKYLPMVFYHFERDYNYLDINTYSDFDELVPIIRNSVVQKKERWLIFIDNIEKCKRLATKLMTLEQTSDKKKIL